MVDRLIMRRLRASSGAAGLKVAPGLRIAQRIVVCVMVYGAGRYKFGDFISVGSLLTLVIFVISMIGVPLLWPLHSPPRNRAVPLPNYSSTGSAGSAVSSAGGSATGRARRTRRWSPP